MRISVVFGGESFSANFTSPWFDTRVSEQVFLIMFRVHERSITDFADIWSLSRVDTFNVVLQQSPTFEAL